MNHTLNFIDPNLEEVFQNFSNCELIEIQEKSIILTCPSQRNKKLTNSGFLYLNLIFIEKILSFFSICKTEKIIQNFIDYKDTRYRLKQNNSILFSLHLFFQSLSFS